MEHCVKHRAAWFNGSWISILESWKASCGCTWSQWPYRGHGSGGWFVQCLRNHTQHFCLAASHGTQMKPLNFKLYCKPLTFCIHIRHLFFSPLNFTSLTFLFPQTLVKNTASSWPQLANSHGQIEGLNFMYSIHLIYTQLCVCTCMRIFLYVYRHIDVQIGIFSFPDL